MPFLPPNQQRQSTEGNTHNLQWNTYINQQNQSLTFYDFHIQLYWQLLLVPYVDVCSLVVQWLRRWTCDSKSHWFDFQPFHFQVSVLGKLPQSPSSIIWYQSTGGDTIGSRTGYVSQTSLVDPPAGSRPEKGRWALCLYTPHGVWYTLPVLCADMNADVIVFTSRLLVPLSHIIQLQIN